MCVCVCVCVCACCYVGVLCLITLCFSFSLVWFPNEILVTGVSPVVAVIQLSNDIVVLGIPSTCITSLPHFIATALLELEPSHMGLLTVEVQGCAYCVTSCPPPPAFQVNMELFLMTWKKVLTG